MTESNDAPLSVKLTHITMGYKCAYNFFFFLVFVYSVDHMKRYYVNGLLSFILLQTNIKSYFRYTDGSHSQIQLIIHHLG